MNIKSLPKTQLSIQSSGIEIDLSVTKPSRQRKSAMNVHEGVFR